MERNGLAFTGSSLKLYNTKIGEMKALCNENNYPTPNSIFVYFKDLNDL